MDDLQEKIKALEARLDRARSPPPPIYFPRDQKIADLGGFDSDLIVEDWIDKTQTAIRTWRIPPSEQPNIIKSYLVGQAKVLIKHMDAPVTADSIYQKLREVYGFKVPISTQLAEFYGRKQRTGERVRAFALALQEHAERIGKSDQDRRSEVTASLTQQFVSGLADTQLRREMKDRVKYESSLKFQDLVDMAVEWSEEDESREQEMAASFAVRTYNNDQDKQIQDLQVQVATLTQLVQELVTQNRGTAGNRKYKTPERDSEGRLLCMS